jgi:hypothetical protein
MTINRIGAQRQLFFQIEDNTNIPIVVVEAALQDGMDEPYVTLKKNGQEIGLDLEVLKEIMRALEELNSWPREPRP